MWPNNLYKEVENFTTQHIRRCESFPNVEVSFEYVCTENYKEGIYSQYFKLTPVAVVEYRTWSLHYVQICTWKAASRYKTRNRNQ